MSTTQVYGNDNIIGNNNVNVGPGGSVTVIIQPADPYPVPTIEEIQIYENSYLSLVKNQFKYISTVGIPERNDETIEKIFTMLQAQSIDPIQIITPLSSQNNNADLSGTVIPKNNTNVDQRVKLTAPVTQILKEYNHVVFLGDPGSGKTTTLRFITYCYADIESLNSKFGLSETRKPVFLQLHDIDDNLSLVEHLERNIASIGLFVAGDEKHSEYIARCLFKKWYAEGNLVVLLDGLDEVIDVKRGKVIEDIMKLSSTSEGSRSRFVVSTRIADYQQRFRSPFYEFNILPITDVDSIREFFNRWIRNSKSNSSEDDIQARISILLRAISESGIKSLLGNPLFLRMLVNLPGLIELPNIAQLYQQYIHSVLMVREKDKDQETWDSLQIEQVLEFISCFLIGSNPKERVELIKHISREYPEIRNIDKLLEFLANRLNLIKIDYVHNLVEFRHPTFQEYFLARKLVTDWNDDNKEFVLKALSQINNPDWKNTNLLFITLLDKNSATRIIQDILEKKSDFENILGRNLLFAGTCVLYGAELDASLRIRIADKLLDFYLKCLLVQLNSPDQVSITPKIERILRCFNKFESNHLQERLLKLIQSSKRSKDLNLFGNWISLEFSSFLRSIKSKTKIKIEGFKDYRNYVNNLVDNRWKAVALKAIGNLQYNNCAKSNILFDALQNPEIQGFAAETIGKIGPGDLKIIDLLLETQAERRNKTGWDPTVENILSAIGLLSQRFPELVELLINIAENKNADKYGRRFAAAYVLCISAETSPLAMHYIVNIWVEMNKRHDNKGPDQCVIDGVKDGRDLTKTVSTEVLDFLLNSYKEDEGIGYLMSIVGNSTIVTCKQVEKDGTVFTKAIDITEELFDLFSLPSKLFGPVSDIIIRCGLRNPSLILRMLNIVKSCDTLIVAFLLESLPLDHPSFFKQPINPEFRQFIKQEIEILISEDKEASKNTLQRWIDQSKEKPATSISIVSSWQILKVKKDLLNKLYQVAYFTVFNHYLDWNDKEDFDFDPFVVAGLGCFRFLSGGFDFSSYLSSLGINQEQERKIIEAEIDEATSIIISHPPQVINILDSILYGKNNYLFTNEIGESLRKAENNFENLVKIPRKTVGFDENKVPSFIEDNQLNNWRKEEFERAKSNWLSSIKPSFQTLIGCAFTISKISDKYPDIWKILAARINPKIFDKETDPITIEYHEYFVKALGRVQRIDKDLINKLLEFCRSHSELSRVASMAMGTLRLSDPDKETVSIILEETNKKISGGKNVFLRDELINLTSRITPQPPEVTKLLLRILNSQKQPDYSFTIKNIIGSLGALEQPSVNVTNTIINWIPAFSAAAKSSSLLSDYLTIQQIKKACNKIHKYISRHDYNEYYESLLHLVTVLEIRSGPNVVLKRVKNAPS